MLSNPCGKWRVILRRELLTVLLAVVSSGSTHMRITARRFAIEWLWAFGCWLAGLAFVLLVEAFGGNFSSESEMMLTVFMLPYVPVLLLRLTIWAVKTVRRN